MSDELWIAPRVLGPTEELEGRLYLVRPGWVISKTDGSDHFISASKLMFLYGVKAPQCLVYDGEQAFMDTIYRRCNAWKLELGLIELRPSYNGDYRLPEEVEVAEAADAHERKAVAKIMNEATVEATFTKVENWPFPLHEGSKIPGIKKVRVTIKRKR